VRTRSALLAGGAAGVGAAAGASPGGRGHAVTPVAPGRYAHGLVVGKFYPPHAGHHALVDAAAAACDRVTVVVAPSRQESVPLDLRLDWLREVHAGSPHVRFVGEYDDEPVDYDDPAVWDAHCAVFRAALARADAEQASAQSFAEQGSAPSLTEQGSAPSLTEQGSAPSPAERASAVSGPEASVSPVDAVFSSEAYGDELARRFGAVHVRVDPGRRSVPVSGTAVRRDPPRYWSLLAAPVRSWLTRRVVVVGAESTGTTTLARDLAAAYQGRGGVWVATRWVPEYGRELTARKLAALGPGADIARVGWGPEDFTEVVREQRAAEEAAARRGSPVLFCDTDTVATAVWQERYLGVAAAPEPGRADLYLLTDHEGVPFEDDGLRDGEHLRAWMTGRFRAVLATTGVPVVEVTGPPHLRLTTATAAVDALLDAGWRFHPPIVPAR